MSIRSIRHAFAALLLVALAPALLGAQAAGRIAGRVVDGQTGRGLTGAQVAVQGTPLRATAGADGRYTLSGVPAGARTLVVSLLGYGTKTVTGVVVPAGGVAEQDLSLASEALAIGGLTVTATRERGSVNRALDEQRTSVGVVNSVTSEQIARSPDSDAAQAIQRVSGVTVQGGQYVFVRGLGERYTTTSLNGARIPSPEPERKVVPLDLFPAGLLQAITTSKTFTPDQPGDFSGAQVNIQTREFPARPIMSFSLTGGYNSAATGQDLPLARATGGEWLGLGAGDRELPGAVSGANLFDPTLPREAENAAIRAFRNAWSTEDGTGAPNLSGALSLGGSTDVAERELGYLASATYSRSTEVREGEIRSLARPGDVSGEATEVTRFEGTTASNTVLWGGLLNVGYRLGQGSRIDFNNNYNRSADNLGRRVFGYNALSYDPNLPLGLDQQQYIERSVRFNQLRGDHTMGERHRVTWSASTSGVRRREPDRSELLYTIEGGARTWIGDNNAAVRTFGDLTETSLEGSADYQLTFGRGARAHRVKVGGLYRDTDRDADAFSYSIFTPGTLPAEAYGLPAEQLFDGRYAQGADAFLELTPLSAGGSYAAADRLAAGYGMIEYFLTERVRFVGGARVERDELSVTAREPIAASDTVVERSYTDVLPSLALNLGLSDAQNLRFSYSRTLSRPEYREVTPLLVPNVIGEELQRGSPGLERALIDNFDVRWELYPNSGEVLSLALFAKRFHDPIERVYLATSAGTPIITFANAESAFNYGLEVEARRGLGFIAPSLESLAAFVNATLMRSSIEVGDSLSSQTRDERAMVGQAPYVVNAGFTYTPERGPSATLLYNVVGERIVSAAEAPLEDVRELARHNLDFSLRFPVRRGLDLKLDAENLLDQPVEVRQGAVLRHYYRTGRTLAFGFTVRR